MTRVDLRDESGMTLIELLVATSAGIVVMFGIVAALIVTLHETGRVTSRVDANQRARIAMTKVVNQLHTSCVTPRLAPIEEGSGDSTITFLHQTGDAVQPTPIKSTIFLEEDGTLKEANYEATGGEAPEWAFAGYPSEPSSTETLATGISAPSTTTPLFSYFAYSEGQVESSALSTPLDGEAAIKAVQVDVAFKAAPLNTPLADEAGAPTGLRSAVTLRLTPPAYSADASDLPCQ